MPSLKGDTKYSFIKLFLVVLIFTVNEGLCNNLPGDLAVKSFNAVKNYQESSEFEANFEDDGLENEEFYNDPSKIATLYEEQARNYSKTTQAPVLTPYTSSPRTTIPPSSCSGSCIDKEALEIAALDSFRKQLLARLGMEHAPNVTGSQRIPVEILEEFCKSRYLPPEYCTGSPSNRSHEYQSDSPRNYEENDLDVIEEEGEVQYMSSESRIFAFPNCKSNI